ncbi:hypothetical protein HU200_020631 [Digitaria exilis]|uniref:Uncharacterized protein n=1 Tax=Digitaria exilis TaxID=1010633 RepID=A0A835F251_9POAL|nr:hypothetical protein HU200_020631 [Digitaria exilis]
MLRRGYLWRRHGRCPRGPLQRAPGRDAAPRHVVPAGVGGGEHLRARATLAPPLGLRALRVPPPPPPHEDFARFVYRFLLERDKSALVYTLRLLSEPPCREPYWRRQSPSPEEGVADYNGRDVDMWIHAAIKRKARVIQFTLVSSTPSLEVLDLKDCLLEGHEISSASLKSLTIIQCRITEDEDLTIAAPNLLSLHYVTPHHRAPLFENMGSLATASVVLNDCFLHDGYEYKYKDIYHDVLDECNDSNSDCSSAEDLNYYSLATLVATLSTCEYCEMNSAVTKIRAKITATIANAMMARFGSVVVMAMDVGTDLMMMKS